MAVQTSGARFPGLHAAQRAFDGGCAATVAELQSAGQGSSKKGQSKAFLENLREASVSVADLGAWNHKAFAGLIALLKQQGEHKGKTEAKIVRTLHFLLTELMESNASCARRGITPEQLDALVRVLLDEVVCSFPPRAFMALRTLGLALRVHPNARSQDVNNAYTALRGLLGDLLGDLVDSKDAGTKKRGLFGRRDKKASMRAYTSPALMSAMLTAHRAGGVQLPDPQLVQPCIQVCTLGNRGAARTAMATLRDLTAQDECRDSIRAAIAPHLCASHQGVFIGSGPANNAASPVGQKKSNEVRQQLRLEDTLTAVNYVHTLAAVTWPSNANGDNERYFEMLLESLKDNRDGVAVEVVLALASPVARSFWKTLSFVKAMESIDLVSRKAQALLAKATQLQSVPTAHAALRATCAVARMLDALDAHMAEHKNKVPTPRSSEQKEVLLDIFSFDAPAAAPAAESGAVEHPLDDVKRALGSAVVEAGMVKLPHQHIRLLAYGVLVHLLPMPLAGAREGSLTDKTYVFLRNKILSEEIHSDKDVARIANVVAAFVERAECLAAGNATGGTTAYEPGATLVQALDVLETLTLRHRFPQLCGTLSRLWHITLSLSGAYAPARSAVRRSLCTVLDARVARVDPAILAAQRNELSELLFAGGGTAAALPPRGQLYPHDAAGGGGFDLALPPAPTSPTGGGSFSPTLHRKGSKSPNFSEAISPRRKSIPRNADDMSVGGGSEGASSYASTTSSRISHLREKLGSRKMSRRSHSDASSSTHTSNRFARSHTGSGDMISPLSDGASSVSPGVASGGSSVPNRVSTECAKVAAFAELQRAALWAFGQYAPELFGPNPNPHPNGSLGAALANLSLSSAAGGSEDPVWRAVSYLEENLFCGDVFTQDVCVGALVRVAAAQPDVQPQVFEVLEDFRTIATGPSTHRLDL